MADGEPALWLSTSNNNTGELTVWQTGFDGRLDRGFRRYAIISCESDYVSISPVPSSSPRGEKSSLTGLTSFRCVSVGLASASLAPRQP